MIIESIGILASLAIFLSMCFKSDSFRGNILMRLVNAAGSIIFVVYGFLLPAYSTAFLNIGMVVINVYYIFKMLKQHQTS